MPETITHTLDNEQLEQVITAFEGFSNKLKAAADDRTQSVTKLDLFAAHAMRALLSEYAVRPISEWPKELMRQLATVCWSMAATMIETKPED